MAQDVELREFIESWIPVNVKDAPHVKVAKLAAREEFMRHIAEREKVAYRSGYVAGNAKKNYDIKGRKRTIVTRRCDVCKKLGDDINQSQDKETK